MRRATQARATTGSPGHATTPAPGWPGPDREFRWIAYCARRWPLPDRRRHRAVAAHRGHLQLLYRPLHLGVALEQRRIGRRGRRLWVALELDVWRDAAVIDRHAGGRVVQRGREFDGAVAGQRHHRLHRALAEGGTSHEYGSVMVLERTGDDFRRGRRTAVHQHHDGRAVEIIAGSRFHFEVRFGCATLRAHDHAAVEELVGHRHRRLEHAAGIVAHIEHQALEGPAIALAQFPKGAAQFVAGRVAELRDAHITIAGLRQLGFHTVQLHPRTLEGELQRFGAALAHDSDLDLGSLFAAHALDGIAQRIGIDGYAVDGRYDIAGTDAGLRGRRIVQRRNDDDLAVFQRNLDSHARVLARTADLQLVVFFTVEVGRIRIERGDHPADRRLQQLVIVDGNDVLALHPLQHLGQKPRVLPGHILAGRIGLAGLGLHGLRLVGQGAAC